MTANLQIFQTSDVHLHLLPYDYFQDRPDGTTGLALAADILAVARQQGATLLFDTGDLIQGTPMAPLCIGGPPEDHPAIHAISALGYDAVTLGNHDFNFGLDSAVAIYGAMPCPVVQSNVHHADGTPLFQRTKILEREIVDTKGVRHKIRIGLFGVVPPQILDWDRDALQGCITVRDMVEAAADAAAELRGAGADLVIALAHTAPAGAPQASGAENRAHEIAALPTVDVVLAGHSHKSLPSDDYGRTPGIDAKQATLAGTPALMPGANGSHIAKLDLTLSQNGSGWDITDHQAQLIALAGESPCPGLSERLLPHHKRTRRFITEKIAETRTPISGAGFFLGFDAAQVLMADAQRWRATCAGPHEIPLVVATAPYRVENAPDGLCLPPGPINRSDLFTIYPYPNAMSLLRVDGAFLKDWLEHSARIFSAAPRDVVAPLLDPDIPCYDFDTLHGLEYDIDPSAPVGARIGGLAHQGKPVAARDHFLLATSTYRAYGGGGFPSGKVVWTDTIPITKAIEAYLTVNGPVAPAPELGWKPVPDAARTVLVATGPERKTQAVSFGADSLATLAQELQAPYMESREVGAGERLANPVRSGRKQP